MSTLTQHCDGCHQDVDVYTVGINVVLGRTLCYNCHYGSDMADQIRSEENMTVRNDRRVEVAGPNEMDRMDEVDAAEHEAWEDGLDAEEWDIDDVPMDECDYAGYDDSGCYDTFDSYDEF